jgi:hypothetical protein
VGALDGNFFLAPVDKTSYDAHVSTIFEVPYQGEDRMQAQPHRQFVAGDRVVFQYGQGTLLRGTIEGWTDKFTAYMMQADTGRKILVPPGHLRPDPAVDPVIRQEREKDWPSYAVYIMTATGTQEVWCGKARTPRLAFQRAAVASPALLEIVRCKTYKRLNARRKYPLGTQGERAFCKKVDTDEHMLFRL